MHFHLVVSCYNDLTSDSSSDCSARALLLPELTITMESEDHPLPKQAYRQPPSSTLLSGNITGVCVCLAQLSGDDCEYESPVFFFSTGESRLCWLNMCVLCVGRERVSGGERVTLQQVCICRNITVKR